MAALKDIKLKILAGVLMALAIIVGTVIHYESSSGQSDPPTVVVSQEVHEAMPIAFLVTDNEFFVNRIIDSGDSLFHSFGGYPVVNEGRTVVFEALSEGARRLYRVDNRSMPEEIVSTTGQVHSIGIFVGLDDLGNTPTWLRDMNGEDFIYVYHPDGTRTLYLDTSGDLTGISTKVSATKTTANILVACQAFYNGGSRLLLCDGNGAPTVMADTSGNLDSFSAPYVSPNGMYAVFRAEDKSDGKRSLYLYDVGTQQTTRLIGRSEGYISVASVSINSNGEVGYLANRLDGNQEIGVAFVGGHAPYSEQPDFDFLNNPLIDEDGNIWTVIRTSGVGTEEIRKFLPTSSRRISGTGDTFSDGLAITNLSLGPHSVNGTVISFLAEMSNGEDAVCLVEPIEFPPGGEPSTPNVPAPGSKLFKPIHGWIPLWNDPQDTLSWLTDMESAIQARVPADWTVSKVDWSASAHTLDPWQAYDAGVQQGYADAVHDFNSGANYTHIVLLAHSAGCGMAEAYCRAYKQLSPTTFVSIELLDPFLGDPAGDWGAEADFRINYFSDESFTFDYVPWTQGLLPNGHNVNITGLTPNPTHQFAREWYYSSVIAASNSPDWGDYGFSASLGADPILMQQDGREVSLPWGDRQFYQQNDSASDEIDFDVVQTKRSFNGANTNATVLELSSADSTRFLGAGVELPVTATFVEFELEFVGQSRNEPEAVVAISIDGQKIGTLEQANTIGSDRYRMPLPNTLEGFAQVGFRIDNDSTGIATVEIRDVCLGSSSETLTREIIAGDGNGDGMISNLDVTAMVLALTNRSAYEAAYPGLNADEQLDMTFDGRLTNADINRWIQRLLGN